MSPPGRPEGASASPAGPVAGDPPFPVGVIGAGAMGMGVVKSLRRAGFATHVRDLRPEAHAEAAALGAQCHPSPAALVAQCAVAWIVVVDAGQVEDVLFGPDGAAEALAGGRIVALASTLDPDFVAALAPRIAQAGGELVDSPVSGGPARAADGSMTVMVAGSDAAFARCAPVFAATAGRVFRVGTRAGDAARFKIVNNLLAAVNLAAGAEALALAERAGLDRAQVLDVVNASSGGSWIFNDRMPRALAGDYAPRAAARILCKDVGITADFAARHGVPAPFAAAALAAFRGTVEAGYGEVDDAAIVEWNRERAGLSKE